MCVLLCCATKSEILEVNGKIKSEILEVTWNFNFDFMISFINFALVEVVGSNFS